MIPLKDTGTSSNKGVRYKRPRNLKFLQLNFRRSETTWALTYQELTDAGQLPDIILAQDPPLSVALGKAGLPGFRKVSAQCGRLLNPQTTILIRDSLHFKTTRLFGPRVALAEITGVTGSVVIISAYIQHTSGDGIEDLRRAALWAKEHCPRIVIGMDSNGHSSLWGPEGTSPNTVGRMIEDIILECDLEVINDPDSPPTFISDRGERSWVDVTLASCSAALTIANWKVATNFFTGSDHHAISFTLAHHPVDQRTYRCKDWDKVDWQAFNEVVALKCRNKGLFSSSEILSELEVANTELSSERVERDVGALTEAIQEAIALHVPKKRICWASKPWWSPHLSELRSRMKNLKNRANRLNTDHDRGLYRRARKEFTREVKRAKAATWRKFCETVNRADMWSTLQKILKPRRTIQIPELQMGDGLWTNDDQDKARLLQDRFFPAPPTSPEFLSLTESRRQEVDSWLATGWGDFPEISNIEVHQKILEMRAISAPGMDGIMTKCLQKCENSVIPILRSIFNKVVRVGAHPTSWKVARVVPVPKPNGDSKLAKGYRPIALINTMSKVLEGIVSDRLSYFVETKHLLSDHQQGFRQSRSTELALWRFVNSATKALKERRRCISVALDIQAAYDSVDHTALLWKLRQLGVPKYLAAWT